MRKLNIITTGKPSAVGPLTIVQPLPVQELRYADPFLLLHHAGPQRFEANSQVPKIDAHPHRGFEPVTFVYSGTVLHRDSLGNTGQIGAGEVQWITSGSGIMHEEGPTEDVVQQGGELELIQLWVNLPASKKMMKPAYQELRTDVIPRISMAEGAVDLAVAAGSLGGVQGPAHTQSPLTAAMGYITAGKQGMLELPAHETVLVYILSGAIRIGGSTMHKHQLGLFERSAVTQVEVEVEQSGNILLLGGEPLNEPVATYGPFVMNTEDEIHQAIADFRAGTFGTV